MNPRAVARLCQLWPHPIFSTLESVELALGFFLEPILVESPMRCVCEAAEVARASSWRPLEAIDALPVRA